MPIYWTLAAENDLDSIFDYVRQDKPRAAAELILRIIQSTEDHLPGIPSIGRPGRIPGTREWVIPSTNYIVIYRIRNEQLEILRVLHGARKWPKKFHH